jgi:Hemerythrin HHE cation binding domain
VPRAVAVLVVAMPCPLILAAPVALVSGLSAAARRGIVVKNGGVLERLARCTTVLLDKTGVAAAGFLIRGDIEQLRTAADALTTDSRAAMARIRQVHALLTGEIWAHESAEESDLYPALDRLLGGADPTATMSRAHAEIAYEIARLGRLTADIGDRVPGERDVADLRGTLYGLHAILRLYTMQEDEAYLSLDDDVETIGGGRP